MSSGIRILPCRTLLVARVGGVVRVHRLVFVMWRGFLLWSRPTRDAADTASAVLVSSVCFAAAVNSFAGCYESSHTRFQFFFFVVSRNSLGLYNRAARTRLSNPHPLLARRNRYVHHINTFTPVGSYCAHTLLTTPYQTKNDDINNDTEKTRCAHARCSCGKRALMAKSGVLFLLTFGWCHDHRRYSRQVGPTATLSSI